MNIDIETYSDEDLKTCSVYRYAASPSFEILLFAVSVDDGPVTVYDLARGEKLPEEIIRAITDEGVIKCAHNATFERICLSEYLRRNYPDAFAGNYLRPDSWRCTMVMCAYAGLPLSLDEAGAVLALEKQKIKEGSELIRFFSKPCKPTKANGGRTRNLPEHDEIKWGIFKSYCKRDVETEMAICNRLYGSVPDFIWDEYHLSEDINDRGIKIDLQLAENAIEIDKKAKSSLAEKLKAKTKLENPNSSAQLRAYLSSKGITAETLGKKAVNDMIKTAPDDIREVLELRQQLAKSSTKKYTAMKSAACEDGRARGMFMFYGASRTGRWSGRNVQLQNLPQNHMPELAAAREIVKAGNYTALEVLYDDIPDTLSQLIRTAFIPADGCRFYVADFSAIEARVLSHIAGEGWREEVFRNNGDIYCASAQEMFGVPVEKHGVNSHLRQKGKIAELALGYGGSTGALKAMGALEMGLSEEELPELVASWRRANPHIVSFWWDVGNMIKTALAENITTKTHGLRFIPKARRLLIRLPSGRELSYVGARLGENEYGQQTVFYYGTGQNRKWQRLEAYGPKFVENIVQAIARDILAGAMKELSRFRICAHVHDELIIEAPPETSLEEICERMAKSPRWMPDILLRADGYVTDFYRKD